jgi:hypothetical protein
MRISQRQIYEKLENIEIMVAAIAKAGKPGKVQRLEEEVKLRKRMNVNQVQTFFGGMSRPWALNRMRKLGAQPLFKFIPGDMSMKRPSIVLYQEAEKKREYIQKIKELVDKAGIATLSEINNALGLHLEMDLLIIRDLMKEFIKSEGGEDSPYYLEGCKLCKRAINLNVNN